MMSHIALMSSRQRDFRSRCRQAEDVFLPIRQSTGHQHFARFAKRDQGTIEQRIEVCHEQQPVERIYPFGVGTNAPWLDVGRPEQGRSIDTGQDAVALPISKQVCTKSFLPPAGFDRCFYSGFEFSERRLQAYRMIVPESRVGP